MIVCSTMLMADLKVCVGCLLLCGLTLSLSDRSWHAHFPWHRCWTLWWRYIKLLQYTELLIVYPWKSHLINMMPSMPHNAKAICFPPESAVWNFIGQGLSNEERQRKQLNIFERKVYRRILGPVYDNEKENWRILTNKEIYASVKKPTIIETIRSNRLHWFGHVQRMEGNRIPKRVLYMNLGTTRLRGRPRNR